MLKKFNLNVKKRNSGSILTPEYEHMLSQLSFCNHIRNPVRSAPSLSSRFGFTLIELIAVIAILGILASLSIPRFVELDSSAGKQALITSVKELNGRESLNWSKVKLSTTGWVDDPQVFNILDTDLGPGYKWSPKAKIDGGKLHYREQMAKLNRNPSSTNSPAQWEITKISSE